MDNSLFDERGNIRSDVFFDCYDKAIKNLYGSIENYEAYLEGKEIDMLELDLNFKCSNSASQ